MCKDNTELNWHKLDLCDEIMDLYGNVQRVSIPFISELGESIYYGMN